MPSTTPLSPRPLLRRVTMPDGTSVVIRLTPELLEFRVAKTRTWYPLPWGHAFLAAARLTADATRRTRKRRVHRNLLRL